MTLTFTDIFCGAGGSSIGLSAAGFELKLAANHWPRAIETHAANFPGAEHLCADVSNYDMRRLPRTDVLWASPICTEISPAGGRKRQTAQLDLLEQGPVARAGFERTRATFMDVIRATEVHRYRAVLVENVVDVATDWELFDWWIGGMKLLGYNVQFTSVSSAHVGDDTNPHAPQWRDRLYMTFTREGIPLPDVTPTPLAWCGECGQQVRAVQSWRRARGRTVGKYRQQYDYRCPNSGCRHALVEPFVLPAAAAIDWTDLGERIGDRSRPLAASTMRRIQVGLSMFGEPTMVTVTHGGDDGRAYPVGAAPLHTRTVKIGDGLATPGCLVPSGGTWRTDPTSPAHPMPARTMRENDALLCAPFVTVLRNHATATDVNAPLTTVSAGGNHHGLTVPPGAENAFYVKNYGGNLDPRHSAKTIGDPFGTVTTRDHHALVVPYRKGAKPHRTDQPLSTVATREQHGMLRAAVDVDDCRYRMLRPREQLRAQRFPDTYAVTGNIAEQTMQAGNAVSSNVAQWLAGRLAAVLA
ncbi:DNA cytosine methyltransferase [Lentzea tibetensis]|uniref:DNA (cytosine-5-)-methyltransferase n=1 Tax=Lentzea tibetensis TaxID=2591470 RepID=A0A563EUU1_9PSEU|nr:DNA cytosine methyltransferase [Lentzea tibetensis]TWP51465.1 DNA cytosine methyltransferase [Lentzea tibetensis]